MVRPGLLSKQGHLADAAWTCLRVWDDESRPVKWMARQLGVAPSTVRESLRRDMPSQRQAIRPPPVSAAQRGVMKRRRDRVKVLSLEMVPGNHGPRRKHPAAESIARVWNIENPTMKTVSASTVRRDLKTMGLVSLKRPRGPKRVVGDEKKRLVFAEALLRKGKSTVSMTAFTDAKYYDSNCHGNTREWVLKGDQPSPMVKDTWAPRVHVWGCIAEDFKFLVRIPSHKPTSASYKRFCLIPLLKELAKTPGGMDVILQHDGDTAYGAEDALRYLASKGIKSLYGWPARSPDLSPIENMWAIVSKRVDSYGPHDVEELWLFVKKAWDSIPMPIVNALVMSFHGRLKACVRAKGRTITTKGCDGKKRMRDAAVE